MKSKTIFFLFAVLAIFGLAVYGYFKATPGLENQTEKRPEIEIAPKFFDFGEVEYGKVAEHTFKVKNLGNENLEIKRVATSCACTTAEVEKKRLAPGEETNLFVRYNTGAMSGPYARGRQERIVYIKSNDPLNPQIEITIYADVE